ncbi:MAG TPA: CSLREA domain-containing protein [Gemmataceae bacterium]|nr:CSLREA domain-containing protein [Gemmataceae bacterium]
MTSRHWFYRFFSRRARQQVNRSKGPSRRVQLTRRPILEPLENRLAPAVLMVTTSGDDVTHNDGTVSLREAILAINAGGSQGDPDIIAQNPGTFGTNDTIIFSPSLDLKTITLTSGVLTLSRSMTINGLGADQLTVSGNNASGVFEIAAGQVTVSGLKIINGNAHQGAGIDMTNPAADSVGTLIGLDIESNKATGQFGGGGVHIQYGTLNLINSTLANNYSANYGAGIEAYDSRLGPAKK